MDKRKESIIKMRLGRSRRIDVTWMPVLIVVLMIAAASSASSGDWVGHGGHWYKTVEAPGGISWPDAQTAAHAAGGYLVSITSADENTFVYNLAQTDSVLWSAASWIGPWIGAYQDKTAPDYSEPAGGWRWDSGDPWDWATGYANWYPSLPNNGDDNWPEEDFACFFLGTSYWVDLGPAAGHPAPYGYIIEANTLPVETGTISGHVSPVG